MVREVLRKWGSHREGMEGLWKAVEALRKIEETLM
jgi:hypothetical protein